MIATLPDLAFAVSRIAHFCETPTEAHRNAAKRVFRHVNGTRDIKICFTGCDQLDILECNDSDGAGDTRDRTFASGYLFVSPGGAIN